MIRSLTLLTLALAVAMPAAAQIRRCTGPHGVTYADGDCPAGTRPSETLAPTRAGGPAVALAGAVPDAPIAVVDTGIALMTQVAGRFDWFDNDTLGATTYGDPNAKVPWMVRKIVAFDLPSHATTTLVARGFIDCTNAEYGLVGVELGDLESRFAVGSRAAPAVQQFDLWNRDTHGLTPAPANYKAAWHPRACLKPSAEDLGLADLLGSKKPKRYLQPEHGTLEWAGPDAEGHPEGPSLNTPQRKIMIPGLSMNEISHEVRYLPFRKGYQLQAGEHDRAFDPPRDLPLVAIDLAGHVTHQSMPARLVQALDAASANGPATMIAVKPGALVYQPGAPASGGGLYLVEGEKSRRIWCTSGGAGTCAITQPIAVSPDGCHVAFDAPATVPLPAQFSGSPTLHVLELCAPGLKVASPRQR